MTEKKQGVFAGEAIKKLTPEQGAAIQANTKRNIDLLGAENDCAALDAAKP